MSQIREKYLNHFTPLVQDFLQNIEDLEHPKIKGIPEPFLPYFGPGYEKSALKVVIIGQDTRGWGDLQKMILEGDTKTRKRLADNLDYLSGRPFTEWGARRQTFWGFAMMFLAALHGQQNWGAMKHGAMTEILDSFAWGNGNALELFSSTPSKIGVPAEYWQSVQKAGLRFNRFHHIHKTLNPQVALILYRGIHFPSYFEGYNYEKVSNDGRLIHYRLPDHNVDIFHAPHPGSMNRIEGADHFRDKLEALFQAHGLNMPFPQFVNGQEEGENALQFLNKNAPSPNGNQSKYEFVAWVADELKKRDTFMSVPALIRLVNEQGYTTNYGNQFKDYGRGPYALVKATYYRMVAAQAPERAHNVAVAFRKPNFEYAYPLD